MEERINYFFEKLLEGAKEGSPYCHKYLNFLFEKANSIKEENPSYSNSKSLLYAGIYSFIDEFEEMYLEVPSSKEVNYSYCNSNLILNNYLKAPLSNGSSISILQKYLNPKPPFSDIPVLVEIGQTIEEEIEEQENPLYEIALVSCNEYISIVNALMLSKITEEEFLGYCDNLNDFFAQIFNYYNEFNFNGLELLERQTKISSSWLKFKAVDILLDVIHKKEAKLDRSIIAPLQDSSENLRMSQPVFFVGENTLKWEVYETDTVPKEIELPVLKVLEKRRPTLNEIIKQDASRKIVKGPRGTGKTTDSLAYAFLWACQQKPDYKGVRKSIVGAFKKTETEIFTSLIPSMEKQFGPCFKLVTKQPIVGMLAFKLPDGTTVNSKIVFKHMQNMDLKDQKKGFEAGLVVVDEIDQLETSSSFEGVCQSARGEEETTFKSGVLGTCNGLCIEGFLYSQIYSKADRQGLIMGLNNKPIYYFSKQPPALIRPADPNGEWLPNPEAYNIENLTNGYNYYTPIIQAGDDRMIRSSVEGVEYSRITGELVFPQLGNLNFVTTPEVEIDIKASLKKGYYIGFDFGKFPVCLIAVLTSKEHLIIFKELYPEGPTNLQAFMSYTVVPFLRRELYNYDCKGVFIDPSGYKDSVLTGMSSKDLLEKKFNLPINTSIRNNNLGPRLNAVIHRATTLSGDRPKLLICEECTLLCDALKNTYVLDDEGKPKKIGHKNFSHDLADCLQYLCLGLDTFEMSDTNYNRGVFLSRAVI